MKWFALLGLLLFLGVAVAQGNNGVIRQEIPDDKLVMFSTEVCGFPGLKPQTLRLTKQQASEIELIFDNIKDRLETISSRTEACVVFDEAVIELNTSGLLPKGISIEQAQKLVVNGYSQEQEIFSIFEKGSNKNSLQDLYNTFFCLVAGVVHDGYAVGIVYMVGMILLLLSVFPSPFAFLFGNSLVLLLGMSLVGISSLISIFSPVALMQQIQIHSGNITTVGLGGLHQFTEGLLNGFNGIKITRLDTKEMYLLGFSLMVSYIEK
jgi:hypothetical protein